MKPEPGFRPFFWLTVFFIPGFIVLICLGVWQVQRLQWKLGVLGEIALAQQADPLSFEDAMALWQGGNPVLWRRVDLKGYYVGPSEQASTFFVYKPYQGGVGWRVATLFCPQGTDDIIAVDRGVLTQAQMLAFHDEVGQERETPILLEGRLWPYEPITRWTPRGEKGQNQGYALSPETWREAGLSESVKLAPFYLKLDRTDVILKGERRPYAILPQPHNRHGGYAATWFGLALGLFVFYMLYHKAHGRLRFFPRKL